MSLIGQTSGALGWHLRAENEMNGHVEDPYRHPGHAGVAFTHHQSSTPPAVVKWWKIYCGVLAAVYALIAILGLVVVVMGVRAPEMLPSEMSRDSEGSVIFMGALYMVMGIGLAGVYGVPMVLGQQRWVWTYGIVSICLTMTSICCLPAAIPLLLYWIKPDCRAWYGR